MICATSQSSGKDKKQTAASGKREGRLTGNILHGPQRPPKSSYAPSLRILTTLPRAFGANRGHPGFELS
jgi:hypothetical protein